MIAFSCKVENTTENRKNKAIERKKESMNAERKKKEKKKTSKKSKEKRKQNGKYKSSDLLLHLKVFLLLVQPRFLGKKSFKTEAKTLKILMQLKNLKSSF
jgi:hypothetical protein